MKKTFTYLAICFSALLLFSNCSPDPEEQTNQEQATEATAEEPKGSAVEYICNQFNGSLSAKIEGSDYMGDAYRCNVEMQYDMQIMSRFNEIRRTDKFDRHTSGEWRDIVVNETRFKRLPYSMDLGSGNVFVPNLQFEDQQETDYFIVTQ